MKCFFWQVLIFSCPYVNLYAAEGASRLERGWEGGFQSLLHICLDPTGLLAASVHQLTKQTITEFCGSTNLLLHFPKKYKCTEYETLKLRQKGRLEVCLFNAQRGTSMWPLM